MSKRKRRRFTAEQKAQAVKLVQQVGSIGQVARDLDLPETALRRWVQQAQIDEGKGPEGALTTEEKEELRRLRRENKTLRMERDFLKRAAAFFAKEGDQAFELIEAEQGGYSVALMCRVLGVSRSGLYAWRHRPRASARQVADAELVGRIREIHQTSRATYGSPRVHAELRSQGQRLGRKRVERPMRANGIQARARRRFRRTTYSDHDFPVAANVLDR